MGDEIVSDDKSNLEHCPVTGRRIELTQAEQILLKARARELDKIDDVRFDYHRQAWMRLRGIEHDVAVWVIEPCGHTERRAGCHACHFSGSTVVYPEGRPS